MIEQLNLFKLNGNAYKVNKSIRLIELFGGLGAQAKALERLGANFETYKYVDFEPKVVASYNAIHGTNFVPSDITKIKGSDLEIVDKEKYEYVLTYSFPCQDLSCLRKHQGLAKGSGTRSSLVWEVGRILQELKKTNSLPQILLLENVSQIINKNNFKDFKLWYDLLANLGYTNFYDILNAKHYNVAQSRNRFFMVSILDLDKDSFYFFPKKQKLTKTLFDYLEQEVDTKYYLTPRQLKYTFDEITFRGNYRINQRYAKCITTKENASRGSQSTIVCDKLNQLDLRVSIKRNLVFNRQFKMSYDEFFKQYKVRNITPKECFKLFGFLDKDFDNVKKLGYSDRQLYKQIGNSIVVDILMAIFKEVL